MSAKLWHIFRLLRCYMSGRLNGVADAAVGTGSRAGEVAVGIVLVAVVDLPGHALQCMLVLGIGTLGGIAVYPDTALVEHVTQGVVFHRDGAISLESSIAESQARVSGNANITAIRV